MNLELWTEKVTESATDSFGFGVLEWYDFGNDHLKAYFESGMKPYDAWVEEMYRMEAE